MCELTGREHAFAVCNGSAALELAVKAIGIQPGDEVIMPTFTIISCALAVIRARAVPVYVDADLDTWNMQIDDIEPLINSKTKAIMAVHIYGITVDMDPLLKIAKKYNLKVIEDAAEVIGQTYKGKQCGSFGDISTFSFYPNKHITTGEGGMVLTDNNEIAEKCRSLRNLAFGKTERFVHESIGWNFRMSNLQAAVGVAQLERLLQTVSRKKEIGNIYLKNLRSCKTFQLPLLNTSYCDNIFWVFGIISKNIDQSALWWMKELKAESISTRPFFFPMHLQPIFKKFNDPINKYPNSKQLSEYGFYLPSGITLTNDEILTVCETIKKIESK
jgi:perosamine synthetase